MMKLNLYTYTLIEKNKKQRHLNVPLLMQNIFYNQISKLYR
ncbi:hypothetical protein SSCHL_1467 [Staphylococcus schleiferi]|nr:hypothetical protein SSCHL_1467 [Staphylococcus schleiferi]